MSQHAERPRASRTAAQRFARPAAALLLTAALAGCTAQSPLPADVPRIVTPLPLSGELAPGTYLIDTLAVPLEITVPDGWTSLGRWSLLKRVGRTWSVFLTFTEPLTVPTDACEWNGALLPAEGSPEAFAEAMAAQAATATTPPHEVVVSGYRGVEFDYAVEFDVVVNGCDQQKVCPHSELLSECTRWYTEANERETYRVLDVNGERVVLTVGEYLAVDESLAEEARAVFESIQFMSGQSGLPRTQRNAGLWAPASVPVSG